MIYYALVFMLVGLIPSALTLAGVSAASIQITSMLIVIGVVSAAILVLKKSMTRVPSTETVLADDSGSLIINMTV
ncbi:MAG TPA: hypothetical protein VFS39_03285 [Nitrospira sp.]|nr:hypothetical protein [Nitrospira sp.]